MDNSNNQLGGSTGGSVSTGNPQNIGSQNITAPQSDLQSQGAGLLNSNSLRLTDQNGQPLQTTNSTTVSTMPNNPNTEKHPNYGIVGVAALIIIVLFITTWVANRKSTVADI